MQPTDSASKTLDSKGIGRIFKQVNTCKRRLLMQQGYSHKSGTMSSKSDEESHHDEQSSRPPKGLRGKEIGLWYRDRQKKKAKETKNQEENTMSVKLSSFTPEVIKKVRELLDSNQADESVNYYCSEFEKYFERLKSTTFEKFIESTLSNAVGLENEANLNIKFFEEWTEIEKSESYQRNLNSRRNLPIFSKKEEILIEIQRNQIILVSGDTGCGKTTQIPQIILNTFIQNKSGSLCKIICTQPRRISAITVSQRVAWERCEKLGKSVGYQIRLEKVLPRQRGSITFCTTGTLLKQMEQDPLLMQASHIILDEIHERNVETDILLGLLKKIIPYRKDLKIILMSATFCTTEFATYFGDCPVITVHGTLFPVKELYLEDVIKLIGYVNFSKSPKDSRYGRPRNNTISIEKQQEFSSMIAPYARSISNVYPKYVVEGITSPQSEEISMDLLKQLIRHIAFNEPSGAILVFLPGYDKISRLHRELNEWGIFKKDKFIIFPLHSMMPTAYQSMIFKRPGPGVRKIILSTNIAETSITIDDVVHVINTGKMKISGFEASTNIQTLEEHWVSVANSKQRRGRAGRVQPGVCYHLYTRAREHLLDQFPQPEILRTRLDDVILSIKLLRIKDVREFFSTLLDAPPVKLVENSLTLLQRLHALDEREELSPLGLHLAKLPLDPQTGKMILMASIFKCIDPVTSVAASLSFKDAFYIPLNQEKKVDEIKCRFAGDTRSDHLMLANILKEIRCARNGREEREFCYENFLNTSTLSQLQKMKDQFGGILHKARFLSNSDICSDENNSNSNNRKVLRAVICSGLYPNIAFLQKSKRRGNKVRPISTMVTPEDGKVQFHPGSVNSQESNFDSRFFVYYLKMKTNGVNLYDTTMIHPLALIIFCDNMNICTTPRDEHYILVAKKFRIYCAQETIEILVELRKGMENLLKKKALYPGPIEENSADARLLEAFTYLLTKEGKTHYGDAATDSE